MVSEDVCRLVPFFPRLRINHFCNGCSINQKAEEKRKQILQVSRKRKRAQDEALVEMQALESKIARTVYACHEIALASHRLSSAAR